jgi:hypothetical protein
MGCAALVAPALTVAAAVFRETALLFSENLIISRVVERFSPATGGTAS